METDNIWGLKVNPFWGKKKKKRNNGEWNRNSSLINENYFKGRMMSFNINHGKTVQSCS